LIAMSSAAGASPASNPAFLGISFQPTPTGVGCSVRTVNEGSSAKDAGLHEFDVIVAADGVAITNCDAQLSALIVAHQPGDELKLDVARGGERVTVRATLSTRADVLHRRWVNRPLDGVEAHDLDDGRAIDLAGAARDHRTTVLGWFDLKNCSDCAAILRRVASAFDSQRTHVRLLAITAGSAEELAGYKKGLAVGAPVATVSEDVFARAVFMERERVHFMVVDARGVVRFVAPVAADADDVDAAIDELVAAAQQAEHARRR
jgi:hypothetical protein